MKSLYFYAQNLKKIVSSTEWESKSLKNPTFSGSPLYLWLLHLLSFPLTLSNLWPPYCPLKIPGSLLPWNLCNVPLEGVLISMLSIYLNSFTYIKSQISPFQWSLSELAYLILQLAQPYSICLPLLCFHHSLTQYTAYLLAVCIDLFQSSSIEM